MEIHVLCIITYNRILKYEDLLYNYVKMLDYSIPHKDKMQSCSQAVAYIFDNTTPAISFPANQR